MALSPQQETFAQAVAGGKSQAEAYREAYPKAVKWKDETIWTAASRLMANTKVCIRVEELRAELAKRQLWTREQSVIALVGVVNNPGKPSDIVAAVKELNAMHGFKDTSNDSLRLVVEKTVTLADFYGGQLPQTDAEPGAV